MSLIPDEHRERLRNEFNEKIEKPVSVILFTQEFECQFCAQTRQLIEELASLTSKIKVQVYDFVKDKDKADQFGVDKVPALVVMGEKDYGVRFYGLPYGYELQSLLESVINVSKGRTDLSDKTREKLRALKSSVHIQVFVTLTCPHCSVVASLAHKVAIENDLIKAEVIDANEFSSLALKYMVMGVPKTVINEKVEFVGAVPEDLFIEHVLRAVQ